MKERYSACVGRRIEFLLAAGFKVAFIPEIFHTAGNGGAGHVLCRRKWRGRPPD